MTRGEQRRIVPETIQTSGMDCGPAALRSLLAGFGVPISYGGLREACRTDVDGTSINALEAAATGLGLDCVQMMVPVDHVLPALLPALLVVGLPSGMPHFVIGWRAHGRYVQVMDPAAGRLLLRGRALEATLYRHEQPVPAAAFAAYADGPAFQKGLRRRMRLLGVPAEETDRQLGAALAAGWRAVATVDAAVRQLSGVRRESSTAVERLAVLVREPEAIEPGSWFARPADRGGADRAGATDAADEPDTVVLRGAVLLQAKGVAADPPDPATLSAALHAALQAPVARPARRLLDTAHVGGRAAWVALAAMALLAGALTVVLTAVLRGAIDEGRPAPVLATALGLAVVLAAVEWGLATRLLVLGRRLEGGLRRGLAERIPLLPDRYLRSRPSSDLAGRAHQVHELRNLPLLLGQAGVAVVELLGLAVALTLIHPPAAALVLGAAVVVALVAVAVQAPLREREQRHVEHSAALAQLELDGVLAVHPIRSLGGIDALGVEHHERLVHWRGAALAAGRARTTAAAVQGGLGAVLAVLVVAVTLPDLDRPATALLVVLWALGIPLAGERLMLLAQHWPGLRTLALRLAEPLDAPVEVGAGGRGIAPYPPRAPALTLRQLSVVAGGRPVLTEIDLDIAPGEHIAIVGASGSGKSTLMAVLLGLLEPTSGAVRVDGDRLDRATAERLWPSVAWVDPQVRVWNATLSDNVGGVDEPAVRRALAAAELEEVHRRVGEQPLGDDGGLLSGGEAQRVRLARALAHAGAGLVVLDEALRGLDRGQRGRLLATARRHWAGATLLCATHDLSDAAGFARVLVVDGGRIVEDGAPGTLAGSDSRFAALLAAERGLRADLDDGGGWRRLRVGAGTVSEEASGRPAAARPSETTTYRTRAEPELPPAESARPEAGRARLEAERGPETAPATAGGAGATVPHRPTAGRTAGPAAIGPAASVRPAIGWLAAYVVVQLARLAAFVGSFAVIGGVVADLGDDTTGNGAGDLAPWIALVLAAAVLGALGTWLEGRFATEASQVLRRRVLRGAFGVDPEHVRREGSGRILGRIMEVEPVAALAATGGLQALVAAVEIVAAGAILLTVPVGRPLAGALLAVAAGTVMLLWIHVRRLVTETDLRLQHTGRLLEDLAGQRTRRVQGTGPEGPTTAYTRAGAAADRTTVLVSVGATGLWQVLALAVLTVAGSTAQATADQLAVAFGAVLLAAAGLRRGGVSALGLATATIALRELGPLLRPTPYRHRTVSSPDEAVLTTEALRLTRGTTTILSGVDLALAAGDRVLLSGPSGSGKSTLVEALAGLRPAAEGRVTGRAGLAPQFCDDHVLLAPMAFNLLLARSWPAAEADLREAWELCGELGLGGLLARMPAGLAQVVGETGWQLSNGERALVGLARALLAGPDVLIVDEGLGPLDPHTARRALAVARRRVGTLVVVSQE